MRTASIRQLSASRRRGVAAWGTWLLRWTLVLLLVADQVGAPLHHHHHDSGVDGTWSTASEEHVVDSEHHHHHADIDDPWATASDDHAVDIDSHVDGDGQGGHFGHATLAVRAADETVDVAAVASDTLALVQIVNVLAPLAMPVEGDASLRPPPRWRSPYISAHRSLPPAGRAPPIHA